jgi:hypothetical protein
MTYLNLRLVTIDPDQDRDMVADPSAHSLTRSLKVLFPGGAGDGVLDNIEVYNALLHAMSNVSVAQNHLDNGGSVTQDFTNGSTLCGGNCRVFCLRSMSGVLGTQQQKYGPTAALPRPTSS